jgi:hypothetical protein
VDPVPDPLPLVAPGIEPGSLDLQPGTLTTRSQMRSKCMRNESEVVASVFN